MPYIAHTPDDQRAMLEAIGAASVDDLFAMVPRRASPGAGPRPAGGDGGNGAFGAHGRRGVAQRLGGAEGLLPRRRELRSLHSRGRGLRRLAERVLYGLHALPGRSQPGHAPGDLRIPDADHATDRDGRVERQRLRRGDRRDRGSARWRIACHRRGHAWSPRPAFTPSIARSSPRTCAIWTWRWSPWGRRQGTIDPESLAADGRRPHGLRAGRSTPTSSAAWRR